MMSYGGKAQTTHVDTTVPKKLQLEKKELYTPAFASKLTPQSPPKKKDSAPSILYVESKPKDTLRFLPPGSQKKGKSDIRITTGADRYQYQHH
jgi:hypothetical protein